MSLTCQALAFAASSAHSRPATAQPLPCPAAVRCRVISPTRRTSIRSVSCLLPGLAGVCFFVECLLAFLLFVFVMVVGLFVLLFCLSCLLIYVDLCVYW